MFDERVIAIAVVVAILLVLVVAYLGPKRAVAKVIAEGEVLTAAERLTVENDRRKTIFEVAGVVLLIVGVIFTYLQLQDTRDQLDINEKALLTDRLVKTIQQISSERETEQIGGMYGLRSLTVDAVAKGDPSYLEILDQTLSAFIRQHAPCTPCQPNTEPRPKDAVQVALYVLGDRESVIGAERVDDSRRHRMVSLTDVDLRGADLTVLHLARVDFRGSNLSLANVTGANLGESDLSGTILDQLQGRSKVRGTGTKWA